MSTDRAFDELVPADLRHLSEIHWTPVEVAVRAAALLSPSRNTRILDIGSGVGKVCAIGALASQATWCGVESHAPLVHVARTLSRALGVASQTMFHHCDAFAIEWRDFDALYLYNPFEIPLSPKETDYKTQVEQVQQRLEGMHVGAHVITLHGFGGVMPGSYELVYQERLARSGLDLVLWVQGSRRGMQRS